jgi:hypothetical protein
MIGINLPPCLKCLKVCPGCKVIPEEQRRKMAEAAVVFLKASFPALFPEPPHQDQS